MSRRSFTQLTQCQQNLLTYIKNHQPVSKQELQQYLQYSISERTLQYELAKLKKMDLLELIGEGRKSKWMLCKASKFEDL